MGSKPALLTLGKRALAAAIALIAVDNLEGNLALGAGCFVHIPNVVGNQIFVKGRIETFEAGPLYKRMLENSFVVRVLSRMSAPPRMTANFAGRRASQRDAIRFFHLGFLEGGEWNAESLGLNLRLPFAYFGKIASGVQPTPHFAHS